MHFAFATVPTPGHVNPLLATAACLKQYGHCVQILSGETVREVVEEHGIDFISLGLLGVKPPSVNPSSPAITPQDTFPVFAEMFAGRWCS